MSGVEGYTTKEIHAMVTRMQEGISEVSIELRATRDMIKKYNNLHGRLIVLEEREATREKVLQRVREWSGWAVAITLGIVALSGLPSC